MDVENNDKCDDLCVILWDLLKSRKYEEVLLEIKKEKYKDYLSCNSLDVVPIITKLLREEIGEEAEKCIEQLMVIIAEVANVKEGLLVFLEEIELSNSDKYFYLFLQPLKIILLRQIGQNVKSGSFSWTFNTLNTHVLKCKLPENLNLDDKELMLLDCDPCIQNVSDILFHIVDFYSVFCDKVLKNELTWSGKNDKSREYLSCFLLQLLHHPLVYLYIIKMKDVPEDSIYRRCSEIVLMISKLINNPFKFLSKVTAGPQISSKMDLEDTQNHSDAEENDTDQFESDSSAKDHVSQLSLASYFYCVLCEDMSPDHVPCIYANDYIFLQLLPLINHLLLQKRYATISKGVSLAESLIKKIPDSSLSSDSLEASNHSEFPHALVYVMSRCDQQVLRVNCLAIFRSYLKKFCPRARLKLLRTLLNTVQIPGVLGILIHNIKENLLQSNKDEEEVFTGENLESLVLLSCVLIDGEKTDLLEWSDQIMAALNLLVFICIRDPKNVFGIKNIFLRLEDDFLEPLLKGIELSRGHYKLKLREIAEADESKSTVNMSVVVGGVSLPPLPRDQEKEVLESALCTFDMMQCVLARVKQLVDIKTV